MFRFSLKVGLLHKSSSLLSDSYIKQLLIIAHKIMAKFKFKCKFSVNDANNNDKKIEKQWEKRIA